MARATQAVSQGMSDTKVVMGLGGRAGQQDGLRSSPELELLACTASNEEARAASDNEMELIQDATQTLLGTTSPGRKSPPFKDYHLLHPAAEMHISPDFGFDSQDSASHEAAGKKATDASGQCLSGEAEDSESFRKKLRQVQRQIEVLLAREYVGDVDPGQVVDQHVDATNPAKRRRVPRAAEQQRLEMAGPADHARLEQGVLVAEAQPPMLNFGQPWPLPTPVPRRPVQQKPSTQSQLDLLHAADHKRLVMAEADKYDRLERETVVANTAYPVSNSGATTSSQARSKPALMLNARNETAFISVRKSRPTRSAPLPRPAGPAGPLAPPASLAPSPSKAARLARPASERWTKVERNKFDKQNRTKSMVDTNNSVRWSTYVKWTEEDRECFDINYLEHGNNLKDFQMATKSKKQINSYKQKMKRNHREAWDALVAMKEAKDSAAN